MKTTMSYHYTSSKMPQIQNTDNTSTARHVKWYRHFGKYFGSFLQNQHTWGSLGGAAVWRLPLAQGAILETRDRVPRRAPCAWSLLLPLPMSLPLSLSLCMTIINK